MIKICGKIYISDKEASARYGYSQEWFKKRRYKKLPPEFIKMEGKGKVLYAVDETDQWFKDNLKR